jgi:hypothetical protein
MTHRPSSVPPPTGAAAAQPPDHLPPGPLVIAAVEARLTDQVVDAALLTLALAYVDAFRRSPEDWATTLRQAVQTEWRADPPAGWHFTQGSRALWLHEALARTYGVSEWHALLALAFAAGLTRAQLGAPPRNPTPTRQEHHDTQKGQTA